MIKIYLIIAILTATVLISFAVKPVSIDGPEVLVNGSTLTINGETLKVDVADTPEKHRLGLSGRIDLSDLDGMLFIFDSEMTRSIWMNEMSFPIDLVWIDSNRFVVGVDEMITPDTFPDSFQSPLPILFLLELKAGLVERLGISVGDTVYSDEL